MRLLKGMLVSLVAAVAVFVACGFLLPERVTVERSIVIAAPPHRVYEFVSNLRNFNAWSPWAKIDPSTRYVFEGPEVGPGQRMKWSSTNDQVGSGSQEITELTKDERVKLALNFGQMGPADAWYVLRSEGSGTHFTWRLVTELGTNPFMRWMGLLFDRWIGEDFSQGLLSLKAHIEGQPAG